jgi:hypothetical protein
MRSQVLHSMELALPSLVCACARRFRPAARRKPVVLTAASTITTSRSLTAVIWVTLRLWAERVPHLLLDTGGRIRARLQPCRRRRDFGLGL